MNESAGGGPLNILVCIKIVRDPNQLQADAEGHPDLARAPFRISTFDDNAIEAALQLVAKHGGRVLGLCITSDEIPRDVLLRAMAMGIEVLYLVHDREKIVGDTYQLAVALAAAARAVQSAENIPAWSLVIAGEASADQFNAQVGPRLAVELDIPAIVNATKLVVETGRLVASRATEDSSETLETDLPALVTVGTEINQARIPTVLQVMGARNKPIKELPLAEVPGFAADGLRHGVSLRTLDVSAPPSSRKRININGKSPKEMASNLLSLLGADGEVKL